VTVPQIYTVIVLAAVVGAVFCAVKLRQACRTVDDAIGRDRTHDTPAAVDTRHGTNTADHDQCELLWDLPAYTPPDPELEAGCDRLWDAITEHRKENDS
jgi:hypothetical protein